MVNLGAVLTFFDIMILCMALPNIAGAALLRGKVRAALDDYWSRYRRGEMNVADKVPSPSEVSGGWKVVRG